MGSDWREVETFWFEFPSQLRPTETLEGEHFSYNLLGENATTAHVKMILMQNELVYRDSRNGAQNRVLTLPRLVSGDRADFVKRITPEGVFLFPGRILNPPSIRGNRAFFAPARKAAFYLKRSVGRRTWFPRYAPI